MHIEKRIIGNNTSQNNIYGYYWCSETSLKYLWMNWLKNDGAFVKKGEKLGTFVINLPNGNPWNIKIDPPISDQDGYIKIRKKTNEYIKDADVLFTITEGNVEFEKIKKAKEEIIEKAKGNATSNKQENENQIYKKQNISEEDDSDNFFIDFNSFQEEVRGKAFYIEKWYKKNGDFVNEGDLLASFRFIDLYCLAKIEPVRAPCTGVLEIIKLSPGESNKKSPFIILDRETLFKIHKLSDNEFEKIKKTKEEEKLKIKQTNEEEKLKYEELNQEKKFMNIPYIKVDEFTNNKIIQWQRVGGRLADFSYKDCFNTFSVDKEILLFTLNNIDSKDFLIFRYRKNDFKLKIGDSILFLFEKDILLKFDIINRPFRIKKYKTDDDFFETRIQIKKDEIDLLKNCKFLKWQIQFKDIEKKITMETNTTYYYRFEDLSDAINKLANDYVHIVSKEIDNYKPLRDFSPTEDKSTQNSKECYVYFMIDNINDYHKIGISNSPDYREKTLQSEKPTVEMICSKKFPNRKIALIFEKTLHQTYSGKRVRGEWFQLDTTEVEEIKKTLA